MDNDELLAAIQDKIRLGVLQGMQEHIADAHTPVVDALHRRIGGLERQINIWKGALLAFGFVFSAVLAAIELAKK